MNTEELLQVMKSDAFTSKYNCYVLPLDHFLQRSFTKSSLVVFNYDNSNESGSHWVAVFIGNNQNVEYFDSYAYPPLNHSLAQKMKILSHDKEIVYNKTCFQGNSSACGQYCLVYFLLRTRGCIMSDIKRILLMCKSTIERDNIVNYFINQTFSNLFVSPLNVHNNKLEL